MTNTTAKAAITINASADAVWNALTDPQLVKQYMFGTDVTSDWQQGSSVTYRGKWEGKPYEDKGTILEIIPGQKIVMTYYSSMSGEPDAPENYTKITYSLKTEGDKTVLEVITDNNKDEAGAKKSEENWQYILQTIKALLEA